MITLQRKNSLYKLLNNENVRLSQMLKLCMQTKHSAAAATKPDKKQKSSSKEIEKYLSSKEHLNKIKREIPVRLLKRNRKAPDDLYLIDSKVAKDVAAAIKPYILHRNKTIIETNPGFGFITKELLRHKIREIHVFESMLYFRDHILNLNEKCPNALKVYNRDFFSVWKLSYQDRHDNGNRVKRLLSGIEVKNWSDDPAMTVVGTLASSNFLRHLILSLIFQFGVMTYGRCELFLTLPPHLYLQLTSGPEIGYLFYRASSVLFQIFCDHEILLKVPRSAFLPWDGTANQKGKMQKMYSIDSDYMYLTRIEFKKDLPVPMNRLQHIWYFVRHMMVSRTNKLIPTLEKWVPGCGARLILANSRTSYEDTYIYPDLDIFTENGQLSAVQILNLYKEFSDWPEYLESSFLASMETAILKMDSMQDIDDHGHEHHSEVRHESSSVGKINEPEIR